MKTSLRFIIVSLFINYTPVHESPLFTTFEMVQRGKT